jgi:hypothetical protein
MDNCVMVAITEIKANLYGQDFPSLEERLKAAMRIAKGHWLVVGEEDRFKAAVGAVMLLVSPDEKARIEETLAGMKMLAAMANGIPVDLTQIPIPANPLPLVKLWHEVKAENAP